MLAGSFSNGSDKEILEIREGDKAEGKVTCLGQGLQKLIFALVNSCDF